MVSTSSPSPWGRLELLTKEENPSLPEYHDLVRSTHHVGRVASRCDIQIQKQFISALHCTIRMMGMNSSGDPIVEIEDHSRYGTWVNDVKVGLRNRATLKDGFVVNLTTPKSNKLMEISYKFVILPSGLTEENQELHAQLSADEKSVATRTRKRTHEEIQSTQSPTRVVPSPPHQGPGKKVRRGTSRPQARESEASEPVSEPPSEHPSTPATQQSASGTGSQVSSSKAAGKRRRRPDVPAPDSRLAQQPTAVEEENERLCKVVLQQAMDRSSSSELLKTQEEELKALRAENDALKKAHEEELKTLRDEKAALTKSHEDELAKVKAQAEAGLAEQSERARKALAEVRQERDVLKQTLADVLADPRTPHQVRTVSDLEVKILQLKRSYQEHVNELANQRQTDGPHTTPPSKKQLAQLERREERACRMTGTARKHLEQFRRLAEHGVVELDEVEGSTSAPLNVSGSSQSQDSIDAGSLHRDRRHNSQLSGGSNPHSEPSPGDLPQTLDAADEETKSGAEPAGRPPLFTIYGARSSTADTSSSSGGAGTPTTLSRPDVHRADGRDQAHSGERKEQDDEAHDGERKEQEDQAGGEETKGNH